MFLNIRTKDKYKTKFPLSSESGAGFTIIELVITIFILSVAIIGIFNAFSIVTILTSDSVDRLTATYLAQEGLEIVRNIRDTNWLATCTPEPCTINWLDGLYCPAPSGCGVDYKSTGVNTSSAGSYLWIDGNGFYDYDDTTGVSTKTKFQRKITITKKTDVVIPPDIDEAKDDHIIKVIVEVSWDKKATILSSGLSAGGDVCNPNNCISVEWMLYDWYNYRHQ